MHSVAEQGGKQTIREKEREIRIYAVWFYAKAMQLSTLCKMLYQSNNYVPHSKNKTKQQKQQQQQQQQWQIKQTKNTLWSIIFHKLTSWMSFLSAPLLDVHCQMVEVNILKSLVRSSQWHRHWTTLKAIFKEHIQIREIPFCIHREDRQTDESKAHKEFRALWTSWLMI